MIVYWKWDETSLICVPQSQLQLSLRVPHPGPYSLVLEYASEVDAVQNVNILVGDQADGRIAARANIYSCTYRWSARFCFGSQDSCCAGVHECRLHLQSKPNVWLFLSASCVNPCSFLCRSVAVENSNRVAVFQLSHRTDIHLQTSTASFLLVRATAKDSDSVSQHLM